MVEIARRQPVHDRSADGMPGRVRNHQPELGARIRRGDFGHPIERRRLPVPATRRAVRPSQLRRGGRARSPSAPRSGRALQFRAEGFWDRVMQEIAEFLVGRGSLRPTEIQPNSEP